MSLELILGPMFSGKTSELRRRMLRLKVVTDKVIIVNHLSDTRYGSASETLSHDKISCESLPIKKLSSLYTNSDYINANYVFINEAQFFIDLYQFCLTAVEQDKKNVVVFGLDGDFQRKPFGEILKLVPLANNVTKLTALCKLCGDGTPGLFTKRIGSQCEQILIGGEDMYQAVCRKHYMKS